MLYGYVKIGSERTGDSFTWDDTCNKLRDDAAQ
jgi:hypothetical protein